MHIPLITGNKSFMNMIGRIKAYYLKKTWPLIRKTEIKYTTPCNLFLRQGVCRYGDKCKYLHIEKIESSYSSGAYSDYSESSEIQELNQVYFDELSEESSYYENDYNLMGYENDSGLSDSDDYGYNYERWGHN